MGIASESVGPRSALQETKYHCDDLEIPMVPMNSYTGMAISINGDHTDGVDGKSR